MTGKVQVKTQTGVGIKVFGLEQYNVNSEVSIQVSVTGTATYSVESTLDDVNDSAITPVWFVHPDFSAISTSAQSNYAFKPRFVRLNQTAGAGSTRMTLTQPGS